MISQTTWILRILKDVKTSHLIREVIRIILLLYTSHCIKGVNEVVKVLSDVLNERQNSADIRRTQTDEHLPFTSILIQKLRAEIENNKNLAQETSAVALLFSNLVKQC